MEHREYGKIQGSGVPAAAGGGGRWVALEKIHGAQLIVAVQGDRLRFGKRKAWLGDGDPFFGWQLARTGIAEQARSAAAAIGAPTVVLYGELFGGAYPHPDVPAIPALQPVQTGVWYAPDLHWATFDALVAMDEDDPGELLSYGELHHVALEAGLLLPPIIADGRRTVVEQAPERFTTRVPDALGLPKIEGNHAEGLVIRRDARERPGKRSAHKRKIAEFDEQQFQGAQRWDTAKRPTTPELVAWVERLVNPARVASATSKWGVHDRNQVLEEIELDVLIDLHEAFPHLQALDDDREVRRAIQQAAERLV